MKFSEQWLREWVNPTIDTQILADQLTMAGLEMDSLTPVAGNFSHVIIGKIEQAEKHPKADRLQVCRVNVGDKLLNIVCGGVNARVGIKVAVAMIGAVLPNGMEIKRAKLREVESEGMLCSYQELGIAEVSEGIMELPEDAPLGKDLREYLDLNDTIIELSITPNRADCLSIKGLAREVMALNHCDMKEPLLKTIHESIADKKAVKIECSEACGVYLGRVIKNINPEAKAPYWLTSRVKRSGTRSISPVVDITNYILYELGQPLHAFDLDMLQGDICVRLSRHAETIELLDGQTVTLKAGTLLIADDAGPIAMAGIMGGLRTAVTESTKNIFLECAWFTPEIIAGKARQYGLSTDAAHRYERGVDPAIQEQALTRAVNLVQELCGGDVGPEVGFGGKTVQARTVILNLASVERVLGVALSDDEKKSLMNSFNYLGLNALSVEENFWKIEIPSYRADITIEADLIEEVARIYGYQRIPTTPLKTTFQTHIIPENKISTEKFCDTLVARGYHEIISYSFVNAEKQAQLYPEGASLVLLNPISSEYSDMRKGLWAGLIEAAAYNQNRQTLDLRLFEMGTRFDLIDKNVTEQKILSGLCTGHSMELQWNSPARLHDFYDIKGDVETLLQLSHVHKNVVFKSAKHPALHPGQTAQILVDDVCTGWVGALHPELAQQWGFTNALYLFELALDFLSETQIPVYQKLSKFPSIRRDISFVIDAKISTQAVLDCIKRLNNALLEYVKIFDVYQGENIAEGHKSLAMALFLQHPERTLVDEEINAFMEKTIQALKDNFSVTLRQ